MDGRGHAHALLSMLRRAEVHALRLGNKTVEGQIQCCIGAILRQLGQYAEESAVLPAALPCIANSMIAMRRAGLSTS